MEWTSLSEVVAGKVLTGEINAHGIDPNIVALPYSEIITLKKDGLNDNQIAERVGFFAYKTCIDAAESVGGVPIDHVAMLHETAVRVRVGQQLEPLVKRLLRGEAADVGKVLAALQSMELGYAGLTPFSEVQPEMEVWLRSFYEPIDEEVGGIPKAGLTIIGGPPGTGKTTLLSQILINCARNGKQTIFYSLEMTLAQVLYRMLEIAKLKKKERALILGSERSFTVTELYADATEAVARNPDVHLIGVDFADLLIEGEESTSKASEIYRTLAQLAKNTGVPVLLMAQLSGNYVGGLPRIHHIRWSRLAEAMATMILLLYNPDRVWADVGAERDNPLPYIPETSWIILGKSRFRTKHNTVGGINVDWNGGKGWGEECKLWQGLTSV